MVNSRVEPSMGILGLGTSVGLVGHCFQGDLLLVQQFKAMLAKISKQIDAEMKLLEHGDGSALAAALSEASVSCLNNSCLCS